MEIKITDKKWVLKKAPDPTQVSNLMEVLKVDEWIAALLVQRGIETFEQSKDFFKPSFEALHDPFLMKDMDIAVARLHKAIIDGEKIRVYGDYDVDGTSSVALMMNFLQHAEVDADYYVPDRYKEGYGVSAAGVRDAAESGAQLMITLDCGVNANESIQLAVELGMDVMVCDHHRQGEELPPAVAILNPNRNECTYPYKGLSGCGVGFKLIQAYLQKHAGSDEWLSEVLDLVTLSIAADIVPVTGENRIIAFYGLQQIKENPRPGMRHLFHVAGNRSHEKTISDLVFTLAPRINAAGRMASARDAVEILMAKEGFAVETLIERLEDYNRQRKNQDKLVFEAAKAKLQEKRDFGQRQSTLVWGEDWHKGVVGIVASRLIEQCFRPTIVLTRQDEFYTGSARSIPGIDIHHAIATCEDLLESFGGHTMAAGLTIRAEYLSEFEDRFETAVRSMGGGEPQIPEIDVDLELHLEQITGKAWNVLRRMGPFGPENRRPVFMSRNLVDSGKSRLIGSEKTHLKLSLHQQDGTGPLMEGVAFSMAAQGKRLMRGEPFSLVYTLEENEWNGTRRLQMMVKDIRYEDC